jgi:hypothetical protein
VDPLISFYSFLLLFPFLDLIDPAATVPKANASGRRTMEPREPMEGEDNRAEPLEEDNRVELGEEDRQEGICWHPSF